MRGEPRGTRSGKESEETIRRGAQALALRIAGHSFEEIARELGYETQQGARGAVKKGLKILYTSEVEELRQLENERLDVLLQESWTKRANIQYLQAILKIIDMRARIMGLYAPIKVAPTNVRGDGPPEYTDEERRRRVMALLELGPPSDIIDGIVIDEDQPAPKRKKPKHDWPGANDPPLNGKDGSNGGNGHAA